MQSEQLHPGEFENRFSTAAQSDLGWLKWLTGSTLLASLAYGSCYVTGLVYHLTYMSEFDIPPDLFRKTSVEYFFYAYLAWLESMPSWLDTIAGDFGPVALLFLLISGTVG